MRAAASDPIDASLHMDRIYRRQRHIYDLTRKYYLLGRDDLIRELQPAAGETVLEIGCGTGRNLIRAARRYPKARFFGLDISSEMLTTARTNIARAGLSDRIALAEADATSFDSKALFGHDGFDRLFFSYTLSMIPDWRKALDHGAGLINPGGRLSLLDFGQQERLPTAFRVLLFSWLVKFDVAPRADFPGAVEAAALRRNLSPHWQSKLRGYAWSAGLDSRV